MTSNQNKKVLITGMNKLQCTRHGWLKQQLRVVPAHDSLFDCLVDMGFQVEQRLVTIGEDLSSYDHVIIFVASPSQLLAQASFNGLWALTQRPDAILGGDDWQIGELIKGIAKLTEENLFREFVIGNHYDKGLTLELVNDKTFRATVLEGVKILASKNNKLILPAFAGGDLQKIIEWDPAKLFSWNPNPYHRNRVPGNRGDICNGGEPSMFDLSAEEDTVDPDLKRRSFNFASLVQSKTKQWLKKKKVPTVWPTEYFGKREEGQRRLVEEDMCKVFGESWVCLMPGYDHAGSGWWRARPLQVADQGSIIIGDFDELKLYYGEALAKLSTDASMLTAMTTADLARFAKTQKQELYKRHPLDKVTTIGEIATALAA